MRPPARAAKLVSVVMATYNGERFIGAAIDSILAQTHSNFELIVVDDASTDATSGILAAFTDPRLRVIHTPANNGVARARNRGFDCARGDYIALLDHDDLSHPTRLARQVEYLETHPGIVLVGTLTQQLRDGRLTGSDQPEVSTPALIHWLLHIANPLACSAVMLRGDAARRLPALMRPHLEYADDYDLYHRLLAFGGIGRIDAPLTIYRLHDGNAFRRHEEKMTANAVRVLAPALQTLLGADAFGAADLIVRHIAAGAPLRTPAALDLLSRSFDTITRHHIALAEGAPQVQLAITGRAHDIWRRVVRAAARQGAVSRALLCAARPVGFVPSWTDLVCIATGDLRGGVLPRAVGRARDSVVAVSRAVHTDARLPHWSKH